MMAETVAVPGVGPVKREYVYGAGIVLGVGVLYLIYRRQGSAGDPESGEYGEPTAAEGDAGAGADAYVNPAPSSSSGAVIDTDDDDRPPTTNAAWTQRSIGLLGDIGWDPREVAAALGRYLTRAQLASSREVEIVRAALAAVGPPPSGEYSLIMPAAATAKPKPSGTTTTTKPSTTTKPKPATTPTGHYVTVVRWRAKNPPWNSTVGGIARHYGRSASYVWNLPKNAGLRKRRRAMRNVQPGDRVWVIPK